MSITPRDRSGDGDTLISVAQAATRLGVHPNTIRAWAEAGRLPAYRINTRGDRRFRAADLDRLLVEGSGAGPRPAEPVIREPSDADLAVLTSISAAMTRGTTSAGVCRAAVGALRSHAGYSRAAIYLAQGGEIRLETHAGWRDTPPATIAPPDDGVTERLAIDPVADRPTSVELPIRSEGVLIGVLVVSDDHGVGLRDRLPFLRSVAAVLATTLRGARLLNRARRQLRRYRALQGVTHELTGHLDLNQVLEEIVQRTRTMFGADRAGLWFVDEQATHPFQLAAGDGISEQFVAEVRWLTMESPSLGVRVVRERRTIVAGVTDEAREPGLMHKTYAREGIRTACGVPLIAQGEVVGVIGLYNGQERPWPDEELALVQAFANQAAVAISNARLYRSVAEQAARMQSIHDLSARLNRLTDVRAIAEAIVAEATTLAEYHDIRVYTVDWEKGVCEPVAFTKEMLGEGGDYEARLRVPIGAGSFTGWAAEHGEPLLINDALHDSRGMTIAGTDDIEESMLVVPMLYEGRALGVIVLSQLGFNRFSRDDLQTMTIFAGYAAQAIANASAYERLQLQSVELARQLDSQRRLLEINERLLSTLDHADVLELIADGLRAVVAYDNLSIYRADHTSGMLVPVLTRERHAEEVSRYMIPFGRGLMGWAVEHGEPVLANDALHDPRALQIPGTPPDPEALIVVPLIGDGVVTGALNVSRVGGEEIYFSAVDFELVKLFAGQASIALRNAEEHHAVSIRADTDALTGLGNHGAFQRDLARILEQAGPGGADAGHVAMLMMDLDQFKAYNDRHGHPAGDALLHAVGIAIYGAARSDDRVYRYGGDEFALILPGASAPDAAGVGERVRRAVAAITRGDATPVTISVGVAAYPEDAVDRNGLVAAADTALYFGKQSGENRVVRVSEVPNEMRDLRGRLDELARAALQHPDEGVGQLVEEVGLLPATAHVGDSVRDALLAIARSFDVRDAKRRGHADRVGRLAGELARRLGRDREEIHAVELAGRLHGLEEAGIVELEPIASLNAVSRFIRGHHALLGGGGRRPADAPPPLGAHIVSVANAYDEMTSGPPGRRADRRAAIARLRRRGSPVRRDVVDALADLVAERPDRGRRRRRSDLDTLDAGEVRGAA